MKKVLLMAAMVLGSSAAAMAQDAKALSAEFKALQGQVSKAQDAMILGQGDANAFYGMVNDLFAKGYALDKVAEQPDAKGKVKNSYRKGNSEALHQLRGQLINGGVEAFNSENNQKALDYFGTYCDAAKHPMFERFNYAQTDTMLPMISYYATLAATRLEKYDAVLKYADAGSLDKENGSNALQLKAEAYKKLGDTDKYVATLNEGMTKFPAQSGAFALGIIDNYVQAGQLDQALAFCDQRISSTGDYISYYMKGYVLTNQKKYDEADQAFAKAVSLETTNAQIFYFGGQNLIDKAIEMENNGPKYGEDGYEKLVDDISEVFKKAEPYFEKAKELAPDQPGLWKVYLNQIYYRLKEMDKYEALQNS